MIEVEEAHLPHGGDGVGRLFLRVEVDLNGEPVGDRRSLWQRGQVAPETSLVQELPLASVQMGSCRTQEPVKECCELGPGEDAAAVLQEENAVWRSSVESEDHRSVGWGRCCYGWGSGRSRGGVAQVRKVVDIGDRVD